MRVVGVDFNTRRVDLVAVNAETGCPQHKLMLLDDRELPVKCRLMRQVAPGASWWDDVSLLTIERPMGPHARSIADLSTVMGAFLARVPDRVTVTVLGPSEWRKAVGMRGSGRREALKRAAVELSIALGGPEFWDEDTHEAHLIARAGSIRNGWEIPSWA